MYFTDFHRKGTAILMSRCGYFTHTCDLCSLSCDSTLCRAATSFLSCSSRDDKVSMSRDLAEDSLESLLDKEIICYHQSSSKPHPLTCFACSLSHFLVSASPVGSACPVVSVLQYVDPPPLLGVWRRGGHHEVFLFLSIV